jgi:hypothetical protein
LHPIPQEDAKDWAAEQRTGAREPARGHGLRFSFDDIDRAQTSSETTGFAKIVTRPGGKLLGAAIVRPHAGEFIHEYALALTKKMNISDLSGVIHIYPTLSQINRRVAEERIKQKLAPTVKKLLRWIFGLRGPVNITPVKRFSTRPCVGACDAGV